KHGPFPAVWIDGLRDVVLEILVLHCDRPATDHCWDLRCFALNSSKPLSQFRAASSQLSAQSLNMEVWYKKKRFAAFSPTEAATAARLCRWFSKFCASKGRSGSAIR